MSVKPQFGIEDKNTQRFAASGKNIVYRRNKNTYSFVLEDYKMTKKHWNRNRWGANLCVISSGTAALNSINSGQRSNGNTFSNTEWTLRNVRMVQNMATKTDDYETYPLITKKSRLGWLNALLEIKQRTPAVVSGNKGLRESLEILRQELSRRSVSPEGVVELAGGQPSHPPPSSSKRAVRAFRNFFMWWAGKNQKHKKLKRVSKIRKIQARKTGLVGWGQPSLWEEGMVGVTVNTKKNQQQPQQIIRRSVRTK